ncbi:MAG: hypothetical protein WC133_00425 [Candidatus Omnitrophota bacterium]
MAKIDDYKKILQRQQERIEDVKKKPRFSPDFKKWRRDTEVAIEKIFGEETRNIKDFRQVGYSRVVSSMYTTEAEYDEAFLKGLDSASAILQSLIDELADYGLKEISKSVSNSPGKGVNRPILESHLKSITLRQLLEMLPRLSLGAIILLLGIIAFIFGAGYKTHSAVISLSLKNTPKEIGASRQMDPNFQRPLESINEFKKETSPNRDKSRNALMLKSLVNESGEISKKGRGVFESYEAWREKTFTVLKSIDAEEASHFFEVTKFNEKYNDSMPFVIREHLKDGDAIKLMGKGNAVLSGLILAADGETVLGISGARKVSQR